MRVWSRLRSFDAKQWDWCHAEPFSWGRAGHCCRRAVWLQATLAAYARSIGLECASLFLDLEKFYEHVSHEKLRHEASSTEFPLALLRGLTTLYAGWRSVKVGGAASEPFQANSSIWVGCSCATTLARVLLCRLLLSVQRRCSSVCSVNVVDDVSATVVGIRDTAIRCLSGATSDLIDGRGEASFAVANQ